MGGSMLLISGMSGQPYPPCGMDAGTHAVSTPCCISELISGITGAVSSCQGGLISLRIMGSLAACIVGGVAAG